MRTPTDHPAVRGRRLRLGDTQHPGPSPAHSQSILASTLLLADSRLPVGAHTQSAGLEPAVLAGLGPGEVTAYLHARLRTTLPIDVATAVVTLSTLAPALDQPSDPRLSDKETADRLALVHAHWCARTPSHVARELADSAGAGYLRLLRRTWPDRPVTAAIEALPTPCRPMLVAALASVLGVDAGSLAAVLAHDEIETVIGAALKLLPLDPGCMVPWSLEAHAIAADVCRDLRWLEDPEDIPMGSLPLHDAWVHDHAGTTRRLFRG
ncbi:urease accessory protein UreF [Actinomycetota bacterium]